MAVHRARSQPHKSLKIPQIVGVKFPLSIFAGGVDHGIFRVSVLFGGAAKLLLSLCPRFCSLLIGGSTLLSNLCICFFFFFWFMKQF